MLGFRWKNSVWWYAVLLFGLNASVADFCQFSFFVNSLLQAEGILVWVYIDNEYGLNLSESTAWYDFLRVQQLHANLGVEENLEKAVPPAQCVKILGYMMDSLAMTVSLPLEKVQVIMDMCLTFSRLKLSPLKDQVLIGNLVFTAQGQLDATIPKILLATLCAMAVLRPSSAQAFLQTSSKCKRGGEITPIKSTCSALQSSCLPSRALSQHCDERPGRMA